MYFACLLCNLKVWTSKSWKPAATNKFVVFSGSELFPIAGGAKAIGLMEFLKLLKEKRD